MKIIKDRYTKIRRSIISSCSFNSSLGVYEKAGSEIYLKYSHNTTVWYEFL